MPLPIEGCIGRIVSPVIEKLTKKNITYFEAIVDFGSASHPDHWYVRMYDKGEIDDFEFQPFVDASKGEEIVFGGVVRKWEINRSLKGVYFDAQWASLDV